MRRAALLALVFLCPAAGAVEIQGPPPLQAPVLPVSAAAPAAELNVFGTPGPGVEPAHVAALQTLADALKVPLFVHGSRQTGVRKTGQAWGPDSDLDLGVIGDVQAFLKAAENKKKFTDLPDVSHVPVFRRDSIVSAVHEGHFVVAPSALSQKGMRGPEARTYLQALAAPWRTERQVARLAAAPRAPDESFRFSVIGDAEPGRFRLWRLLFNTPGVFARQLADADRRGGDFIVQLGDMVSRGLAGPFTRFFELLARVAPRTPYLTVIGNHDRHRPHGVTHDRVYRSLFGKTDYYFDRGGYRFVTLDSSAGRVTREQLAWLDAALATPLKKVVFTHMMPYAIRTRETGGGAFALGGFQEGSEEFTRIASRREVERVYMGHIHALGVRDYGGVRYVLTGGGGSPLYPTVAEKNVFHHYLSVSAGPEGLTETVRLPDGREFPLPGP